MKIFRGFSWDKNLYFFCLGVYIILYLAAILSGITSWDEETDYLGVRTQIAHAVEFLRGQNPSYKDIHSNLEYYGIAGLLPAWTLWFLQQAVLIGRLPLSKALYDPSAEHQLTGFFATSHLVIGIEFILLSFIVIKIAKFLGSKLPWLAGALVLFNPSLLGHSFVNAKDIPFALFYTTYTYTLLLRRTSSRPLLLVLSILSSSLLINQKYVAFLPVILSEVILILSQKKCFRDLRSNLALIVSAPFIALLLQPAAWGLNPFIYITEAFQTFSNHKWGGCMTWQSECIGINHPQWSTLNYIWRWFSIKLPLLWLILLSVQLIDTLQKFRSKMLSLSTPWFLLISQALLIPILAVANQSNLYDADRHFLFIYPALAVVCTFGFERVLNIQVNPRLRKRSVLLVVLMSITLFLDSLSLNPYQSAYLNEFARFSHNHKTTSLDYWAVSSKELIRNAQINGSFASPPSLKQGIWISPFWISFRQLSGQLNNNQNISPLYQVRVPSEFQVPPESRDCNYASSVERYLLPFNKLVMSKLYLCSKP